MDAIERACETLGGQRHLALALGVTPPAVHQWVRGIRPVPAERCPTIERLTRGVVRCEDLRPDIEWGVLRNQGAAA